MNSWVTTAVDKIRADAHRSADTHLIQLEVPGLENIDIYIKDESTHPTGSLKHRLARSLFLYALCNGKLTESTPVIEASSGSTAVSEAYFARMIGVPFIAVMPKRTAQSKIRMVKHYNGQCHFVESAPAMHDAAVALADDIGGHFMDQFKYAERATDWRGNNNIAESVFRQMARESHPVPKAIVMSAGTGGTSATLGRYILYKGYETKLIVVDPENSVFYECYQTGDRSITRDVSSRIEGIGRPKVERSFQPSVIDDMMKVPDAASIAAIGWFEQLTGRKAGPSTGTNLWGAISIAKDMQRNKQQGSIVTLMCDGGDRYFDTYYDSRWVAENIGDTHPYRKELDTLA